MATTIPILFEVGVIRATGVAQSLLIHPLVVSPQAIAWTNPPRDQITQVPGGSTHAMSGRGLASCSISGTFGYEDRVYGTVWGTGQQRLQRFRTEVVDLPSVTTPDALKSVIESLTLQMEGDPSLTGNTLQERIEALRPVLKKVRSIDVRSDILYLNVYDFYNRRFHRAGQVNFQHNMSARGGGAVLMQNYQLSLVAYGPPISPDKPTPLDSVLRNLVDVVPTWQRYNDILSSADVTDAISAAAELLNIPASLTLGSISAVAGRVNLAIGLATGAVSIANGTQSLVGTATSAASEVRYTAGLLASTLGFDSVSPDTASTEIDWSSSSGWSDPSLATYAQTNTLYDAALSLDFQRIVGRFMGMSDSEYAAFLSAGNSTSGQSPTIASTVRYTIQQGDSPARISARYGVPWIEIVRANRLTADDIYVGRVLSIPIQRAWGPPGTNGVPTFGSHLSASPFGSDLRYPLETSTTSDVATVEGIDCLLQGIGMRKYALETIAFDSTQGLDTAAISGVTSIRAQSAFQVDPRISAARVSSSFDANTGTLAMRVQLDTIAGTSATLQSSSVASPRWDEVRWDEFRWG